MKYSLRKSFHFRRRKDLHDDDDHFNARIDQNTCSNSNSNLVKANQSKTFLRRRRCSSSSSPPPPPLQSSSSSTTTTAAAANKIKLKTSKHPYNNHIDDVDEDDDDDDDPFSSSTNPRMRPLDKLTYQIRKSFRNTLTRQRPRLESNNSNKRLISTTTDENRPVNTTDLTSPIISLPETTIPDGKEQSQAVPKRRRAPLAPTHISQSTSLPNQDCVSLRISDHLESGYVSASNETEQDLSIKKNQFNRSIRTRLSLLLKRRHAKQQQKKQEIPDCIDEDADHVDTHEINTKKPTLGQRFDTLRRSFQFGNRNSTGKGKRYLLSNE